jgi:SAM-dependent methyltransferase
MMSVIAPENADQARAWNGPEGEQWATQADRYDAALRGYRPLFIERTAVTAADAVLDVGCGNGETTRDAARVATAGTALGIDLSTAMIRRATGLAAAEGLANATFRQGDAQVHPFEPASFDLVISRTGAMFFGDRAAAFANLARALRPGGRIVLLAWRALHRNAWITAIRDDLGGGAMPAPPAGAPGPFALAEPALVEPVLAGAGFTDIRFEAVGAPFRFGADVDDALGFAAGTGIAQGLLSRLDDDGRAAALDRLRATMAANVTPAGVCLDSEAWLITAHRGGSSRGTGEE